MRKQVKRINAKLKKCHDPDRWDLIALQRARREQANRRASSEDGEENPGFEEDSDVFGDKDKRDVKRRKVAKAVDDPFGGPLG